MGGSSDDTSQTTIEMPKYFKDLLFEDRGKGPGIIQRANDAYGAVQSITNGLGLTNEQMTALYGTINQASQNASGALGNQATNYISNLISSGGLTPGQSALANQLLGSSYTDNPTASTLSSLASGSQIGKNPYTQALVDQANADTIRAYNQTTVPQLDNAFLAAGREGSGLYASQRNTADQTLAQQLGENATNIYSQAYNTDRANQLNALGQLNSVYQSNVANQLSGAGLQQAGTSNIAQGIGLGSAASQLTYSDLAQLFNTGTMATGNAYTNVNNLLQTYLGTVGNSNLQTQSGTAQGVGVLGGAASGAALGTAAYPGWGTLIGAGVGAVAGGTGIV